MSTPPSLIVPRRFGLLRYFGAKSRFLAVIANLLVAGVALRGEDTNRVKQVSDLSDRPSMSAPAAVKLEAAVAAARERAKLLHDVYATTLEVMHLHYFRRDGPVLPARAMEDVFEEMSRLSGTSANWIAVNTTAMSIHHEPKTAFEKQAAVELSAGKKEYESVGMRVYRRAAPIPLRSSCVSCHTKMFSEPPKSPRIAGLVISIPLKQEAE